MHSKVVDIIAPGVNIESTWIGPTNKETLAIDGTSMGQPFLHHITVETRFANTSFAACPHVAGIVCTILSNPAVNDKTPFNVASELLILADKNKISSPQQSTVNAVAHISS